MEKILNWKHSEIADLLGRGRSLRPYPNVSALGEENYKESTRKIISDTLSEYRHQVEKAVI